MIVMLTQWYVLSGLFFIFAQTHSKQMTAMKLIHHWRQTKIINYYQLRLLAQLVLPSARDDTNFRAVYMGLEIVKHVDLEFNLLEYWNMRNAAITLFVEHPNLSVDQYTTALISSLFDGKRVHSGDHQRAQLFCDTFLEVWLTRIASTY